MLFLKPNNFLFLASTQSSKFINDDGYFPATQVPNRHYLFCAII